MCFIISTESCSPDDVSFAVLLANPCKPGKPEHALEAIDAKVVRRSSSEILWIFRGLSFTIWMRLILREFLRSTRFLRQPARDLPAEEAFQSLSATSKKKEFAPPWKQEQ
jgi:hypothetical protein